MKDVVHIPQEDLALYAIQALAPEEMADVRQHLDVCEMCRGTLAQLPGDLALVAMSTEQLPLPHGARERFLERISGEVTGSESATGVDRPAILQMPQRHRLSIWIPWSAAAALLAISAGLGIQLHFTDQALQQQTILSENEAAESARARQVLDVLTARNAQHVLLTASPARALPSARAVYLPSRGALILEAVNLAPIAGDKTYELWIIPANGKPPIPAGLFHPDAAGNASVVLPDIPKNVEAKAFGVTIENTGGSSTPTLPIVISGAPTAGE